MYISNVRIQNKSLTSWKSIKSVNPNYIILNDNTIIKLKMIDINQLVYKPKVLNGINSNFPDVSYRCEIWAGSVLVLIEERY